VADPLVIFVDAIQIWAPVSKEQIHESLRHLS
jgi:hypothetical protein